MKDIADFMDKHWRGIVLIEIIMIGSTFLIPVSKASNDAPKKDSCTILLQLAREQIRISREANWRSTAERAQEDAILYITEYLACKD